MRLLRALPLALIACASSPSVDRPVDAAAPEVDVVLEDAPATPDVDVALRDDAPPAACASCETYGDTVTLSPVSSPAITEASGIVESPTQPGVYFVHNDSGDTARVFAVDANGDLLATYRLDGATAVDWEDLTVGPCPTGECLYLGDIGDNAMNRADHAVLRVALPTVARGDDRALAWERLDFAYPDGPHNAEALAMRRDTGDLYVSTKADAEAGVYRFPLPLDPASRVTLTRVATLALPNEGSPLVTAADLHPCEARLLVRTYTRLWEFTPPAGAPFEAMFTAVPRRLPVFSEIQGESVAWHADGRGYVTVSEGRSQALHDTRCAP
ncbi:MAG: hypothetical protein R3A52_15650 [Polyangiales bacterium]